MSDSRYAVTNHIGEKEEDMKTKQNMRMVIKIEWNPWKGFTKWQQARKSSKMGQEIKVLKDLNE